MYSKTTFLQTIVAAMAGFVSISSALPSGPGRTLVARAYEYRTPPGGDYYTRDCTEAEKEIIDPQLKEALEIINYVYETMEPTDPAFRTFFSGSDVEPTEADIQLHKYVKEKFRRAYRDSIALGISCGDIVTDAGAKAACSPGTFAATITSNRIVLCPPFFKRASKLETELKVAQGKTIDICGRPDDIRLANTGVKTIIHEVMHTSWVGSGDAKLVDCYYGPWMLGIVAKHSPKAAKANADTYAYAAVAHRLNDLCGNRDQKFYQAELTDDQTPPHAQPVGAPSLSDYERCKLPEDIIQKYKIPTPETAPQNPPKQNTATKPAPKPKPGSSFLENIKDLFSDQE